MQNLAPLSPIIDPSKMVEGSCKKNEEIIYLSKYLHIYSLVNKEITGRAIHRTFACAIAYILHVNWTDKIARANPFGACMGTCACDPRARMTRLYLLYLLKIIHTSI